MTHLHYLASSPISTDRHTQAQSHYGFGVKDPGYLCRRYVSPPQ
jgi:hypothetical protein